MALVLKDRVQETATANTTVSFSLAGAVTGFQTFSSTIGNTNTTYYSATDASGNWEVGLGTYATSGNLLTRTTILESSNSNTAVTFTGTVTVFVTYAADKTIIKAANDFVGIGIEPDGSSVLQIQAGTSSTAPLELTSSAGTVMTTPDDGSIEYDGEVFYGTPIANSRGVMLTEHFVARTGTKTMTSNTNLQAIFSGGTGGLTNGALTVADSCSYYFECLVNLSSMSGTSGNFGFSIVGAGTATFTSAGFIAIGYDQSTLTTPAAASAGGTYVATSALTSNVVTATTGTSAAVLFKGIFRINAAGTIIPSIQLTNASAAVIGVNSWFKCYPVGLNTAVSIGNWS